MDLNNNINIDDFHNKMDSELSVKKPRTITFVSAQNDQINATININVDELDGKGISEIIGKVAQDGGIFGTDPSTGNYFFIPWPCAIVIISN